MTAIGLIPETITQFGKHGLLCKRASANDAREHRAIALLSALHSPPDTTAMQLGFEMERTQPTIRGHKKSPQCGVVLCDRSN